MAEKDMKWVSGNKRTALRCFPSRRRDEWKRTAVVLFSCNADTDGASSLGSRYESEELFLLFKMRYGLVIDPHISRAEENLCQENNKS